jgi:release factor glutamine methyltransferase
VATNALPGLDRLSRVAWGRLLWWRFRLFQRHRHDRLVLERVAGRDIVVLPRVLNPKLFRTGEFLAEVIESQIPHGASVLDMGTGAGIGAIVAGARAARVIGVDVNPMAVRCARINVLLNGLENRVEIRQGDLFEPVRGESFDVVLFNPPYLPGEPRDLLDRAFRAGDVIPRFARDLASHLSPDGVAFVLLSTEADCEAAVAAFRTVGLRTTPLAVRDLKSEVLTVYQIDRTRGLSDGARS